jgi:hypothetical protein
MKTLITLIGVFAMMWGTPALAGEKLLSEKLLDGVTAGSSAQQAIDGNTVKPEIIDPDIQNAIDAQGVDTENLVAAPNVNVNNSVDVSQSVESHNKYLVLKDDAQKDVNAINVVNSIEGQVTNGLNVHVNDLRLRPDISGSGSSLNNLYQTNIINVNRN